MKKWHSVPEGNNFRSKNKNIPVGNENFCSLISVFGCLEKD
jgi:hypothetical protein